jgi:pimeloyl-ACP methyl ester carboxylesterase
MNTTTLFTTSLIHRLVSIASLLLIINSYTSLAFAQSDVQSGLAPVNGTELYYEMTGEGHPLVLIHGGAVDSRALDDQFLVFAQHYKVIRYDLRGTGKSGNRDKPFSNMDDLYALLKYLNIEKTYLLGISRGGGFAYDLTLAHPEMVDGLILVSANLSVHVPAYSEMFERSTAAGKQSGAAASAAVWGNDPHQGPRRESARNKVLQILTDNMPRFRYFDGYAPVEQIPASNTPRSERLGEIQAPTLVISGAHDNIVSRNNSLNWSKGIPNASLVVFPDSAHLVNIDQVDEFNQTVLEFLKKL